MKRKPITVYEMVKHVRSKPFNVNEFVYWTCVIGIIFGLLILLTT